MRAFFSTLSGPWCTWLFASGLLASGLLGACGGAAVAPVAKVVAAPSEPREEELALRGITGAARERVQRRQVGDLWVHRFHGAYHASELFLTEEVVAQEGALLVVDFTLEEAGETLRLRVRMQARSERVVSVTRQEGEQELPASKAEYEALLARTLVAPEQNLGRISQASSTCLVGRAETDCELSQFRVYLGEQEARLTVSHSVELARDVAGELAALDGTILHKAELIEARRGGSLVQPEVAQARWK